MASSPGVEIIAPHYYRIDPVCWNRNGGCLHWVQCVADDRAYLAHGCTLNSNDPHFASAPQQSGNVWHGLTPEYATIIRAAQPEPIATPSGWRPIVITRILNQNRTVDWLNDDLFSDCHVVYFRDVQTHAVVEVMCCARGLDPASPAFERELARRNQLLVSELLGRLAHTPTQELCVSHGATVFRDTYYRQLRNDEFLCVMASIGDD